MLDQALGLLDHHFGDLHVAGGGLVEGRADDFAAHGALHVGDFLGALVDEQHDERDLGMVGGDGVGDGLQEHRFAGAGRGDDQAALPFADGREQIHDAAREVVLDGFELHALVGIERREVVEEDLVARFLGRLEVDGVNLDESEIALAFLGRADLAGDGVAGAQVEAADLRGRDVDVIGAGQIVVLGGAQEAEAIGQAFEDALGEDEAALFGLGLQDLEDQLLLAESGGAGHGQVFSDLVELLDAHVLQFDQVERGRAVLGNWLPAVFAALAVLPLVGAAAFALLVATLGAVGALVGSLGGVLAILGCRRRGRSRLLNRFVAGGDLAGHRRLLRFFLRRGRGYRLLWCVFAIACQISLTPRPVMAEHASGSPVSLRMPARLC